MAPIALSMGLTKQQQTNFYLQNLTYQFGRILTYTVLGAILGIIGEGFEMAGFQQVLTISVGIMLIIMALFSFGGKDFVSRIPFINNALLKVKNQSGPVITESRLQIPFYNRITEWSLPCGMVYMALTASLAAGGVWQGLLLWEFSDLELFHFMFAVVLVGNLMNQALRIKVLKVIPIVMIILGGLFILRGMEIGIPYLSPASEAMGISKDAASCHTPGHSSEEHSH